MLFLEPELPRATATHELEVRCQLCTRFSTSGVTSRHHKRLELVLVNALHEVSSTTDEVVTIRANMHCSLYQTLSRDAQSSYDVSYLPGDPRGFAT